MEGYLKVGIAIALALVAVTYLVKRRNKDASETDTFVGADQEFNYGSLSEVKGATSSKPRLTELQFAALLSAASETIYVESEERHAATGGYDLNSYPKRTIESLVKRGLLEATPDGGFRATREGWDATIG